MKALRECRVELTSTLDVRDIINVLIQDRVVSGDKAAQLTRADPSAATRAYKVGELLDFLNRRSEEDFKKFVKALLSRNDSKHLGEELQRSRCLPTIA